VAFSPFKRTPSTSEHTCREPSERKWTRVGDVCLNLGFVPTQHARRSNRHMTCDTSGSKLELEKAHCQLDQRKHEGHRLSVRLSLPLGVAPPGRPAVVYQLLRSRMVIAAAYSSTQGHMQTSAPSSRKGGGIKSSPQRHPGSFSWGANRSCRSHAADVPLRLPLRFPLHSGSGE
jgi:hypothetical protein